jgi:hypothetical protein
LSRNNFPILCITFKRTPSWHLNSSLKATKYSGLVRGSNYRPLWLQKGWNSRMLKYYSLAV